MPLMTFLNMPCWQIWQGNPKKDKENEYIITWILHQIFMYSNKVKLVAG